MNTSDAPQPKRRGRPPTPDEEKLISGDVRFTRSQWEKIAMYGRQWLRDIVDKSKPPKGWTPPNE